jgi:hypothetical protein
MPGLPRKRPPEFSRWTVAPRFRHFPCRFIDIQRLSTHNRGLRSEGFPSGQRGQTVNLLAQPSKVRILPPPPEFSASVSASEWPGFAAALQQGVLCTSGGFEVRRTATQGSIEAAEFVLRMDVLLMAQDDGAG